MPIEFNEDQYMQNTRNSIRRDATPGMVKTLMKWGIVKSESGAFNLLVGICVVCILASVYIFYAYVIGFPVKAKPLTPEQQKARDAFKERIQKARENAQNSQTNPQP